MDPRDFSFFSSLSPHLSIAGQAEGGSEGGRASRASKSECYAGGGGGAPAAIPRSCRRNFTCLELGAHVAKGVENDCVITPSGDVSKVVNCNSGM